MNSPTPLQDAFLESITSGDEVAFHRLWPKVNPWVNEGEPVAVAIEQGCLFAIDAFAQSLSDNKKSIYLMDQAVVRAATLGQIELMDRLIGGKYQSLQLTSALVHATRESNETAVNVLLNLGANPQSSEGKNFALGEAIKNGHLALMERLLPLSDTWAKSDIVLRRAIEANRIGPLDMLLKVCDPNAMNDILPYAARHGNPQVLAAFIQVARQFPLMPIQKNLNQAMIAAATYGHPACLTILMKFCDPKFEGSRALAESVAGRHEDCARLLIPHSDLDVVKKAWLAKRPQAWDRVDQLASWSSSEICEDWCALHPGRLPGAVARLRVDKTAPLDGSKMTSSGRRTRSRP